MGGTGANSLARDVSCLTQRQRAVYDLAASDVLAGRYPSRDSLALRLGMTPSSVRDMIRAIVARVGWPCPIRDPFWVHHPNRLLTPLQSRVHSWAVAEHRCGRYPSDVRLAAEFGFSVARANEIRRVVTRKTGWPCSLERLPSGTYGLTGVQKRILATAIDLHDGGEYPSLVAISRILGLKARSAAQIVRCRRLCVEMKIWPVKVKQPRKPLTPDQVEYILDYRRSGRVMGMRYATLRDEFQERFGRRIALHTIGRVLKRSGLTRKPNHRPIDIDAAKRQVIADRHGVASKKLTEPAAYAKAVRASRQRKKVVPAIHRQP